MANTKKRRRRRYIFILVCSRCGRRYKHGTVINRRPRRLRCNKCAVIHHRDACLKCYYAHTKRFSARAMAWAKANPLRVKSYQQKYYRKNQNTRRLAYRMWYEKDLDKHRRRSRESQAAGRRKKYIQSIQFMPQKTQRQLARLYDLVVAARNHYRGLTGRYMVVHVRPYGGTTA